MKESIIKGMKGKPVTILVAENKKDEEKLRKMQESGEANYSGPQTLSALKKRKKTNKKSKIKKKIKKKKVRNKEKIK